MCGIAGYVSDKRPSGLRSIIQTMTEAVSHRGPDGHGLYISGAVALGHRRLSIIDLSDLASQPMTDKASGCVIVFNGEIYNYVELRQQLSALGCKFVSKSDTEVILKAYGQWGEDCVRHFNGMWSFAIHDPRRNIIFCSRDRFGEKPFYYADLGHALAFGSEARQLLPLLPAISAHRETVLNFIHRRIAEPLEQSFYGGVRKLAAGHNLTIDIATRRIDIRRYYEMELDGDAAALGFDEALEQFLQLLTDSLRIRLRSDVRVGTCLSGGLDSSSIASLASPIYNAATGQKFSAITAISEDDATDESAFAKKVIDRSSLDWHTVRPTYEDFRMVLDQVVSAQEEPFSSASVVMQYMVMREARRLGIPVLLDGQGGDETLLGYHRYFATQLLQLLRQGRFGDGLQFARSVAANGGGGAIRQLFMDVAYFHLPGARQLALRRQSAMFEPGPKPVQADLGYRQSIFQLQKAEIEATNLPALLRHEDKNAMWHSVETRLPFLDHRLVQFAASVSTCHKLKDGWGKFLLRKAMDGKMSGDITWRKDKLGFEAPESKWMLQHQADVENAITQCPLVASLVRNSVPVAAMHDKVKPGLRWRLYSLALWAKSFGVTDLS